MNSTPISLGLHIGHDRGITVVRNGQIDFHLAVERLDRLKHSESPLLPLDEVRQVLNRLSITQEQIAAVCVTYHSIEAERIAPTLEADFKGEFRDFNGLFTTIDHHRAHALAAIACSPFEESLVFVADGAGDLRLWGCQSESLFHATRRHCVLLADRVQDRPLTAIQRPEFYETAFFGADEQRRQISLGLKYEQVTYLCGFGPGQAGQTMALAAYGEPLFDVGPLVPEDLGFSLRYVDLLDKIDALARSRGMTLRQFARKHRADVAATAQCFLRESLASLVRHIVREYDPANLCFAGGVFLNCSTNRHIADQHADRNLFFLPACNDEGQSIGAAAHAHWMSTSCYPPVSRSFPYLGFSYSQQQCNTAFSGAGLEFEPLNEHRGPARLAQLLASGKICAVFRDRSECGPRALGHRSILADPRTMQSKYRLDAGIKRRAEFRPYAPMVLESRAAEYFDLATASPYMLLTAQVRPEHRAGLPAVTHTDGSARLQTVSQSGDPFLSALLTEFECLSGVPVLLNTSFNDEREPIVESPDDAVRTFLSTDLDVLVMGTSMHIKRGS